MKKNTNFLIFSFLISSMAFADTALRVSAPATKKQLEKAIEILAEAAQLDANDALRASKIKKAVKLTQDRSVIQKFEAELHCNGAKQFEGAEMYDVIETCCYKGDKSEAKRLIDTVLAKTEEWSWDEYSVSSVKIEGQAIKLTVHDGPNDEDSFVVASSCPR